MKKKIFGKNRLSEYLKLADYIVFSPGGDNRNNYANVNEIVSHAVEQRVHFFLLKTFENATCVNFLLNFVFFCNPTPSPILNISKTLKNSR